MPPLLEEPPQAGANAASAAADDTTARAEANEYLFIDEPPKGDLCAVSL
jgi:hypothetical protein